MDKITKETAQVLAQGARESILNLGLMVEDKFDINWHHRLIEDRLLKVYGGLGTRKGLKRLMIAMPPQIANKSTLASKLFPAWALGKNPDLNFIVGSYNATMARSHSKKSMNITREKIYEEVFGTKLNPRKRSADYWGVLGGRDGGYRAFGMKTGITGNPADVCFVAGTKVKVKNGYKNIENCEKGDIVLSYNNDLHKLEYKKIIATKKSIRNRLAKVTLSDGRSFIATKDHPVFISGKGYIKIQDIKTERKEKCWVFEDAENSRNSMQTLSKHFSIRMGGIYQKSEERLYKNVLLKRMLQQTIFNRLWEKVQNLWKINWKKNKKVLFKKVQTETNKTKKNKLFVLWKKISTNKLFNKVLFKRLQRRFSLNGDERKKQPKLEARERDEQISERVSKKEIFDKERPKQKMYSMWSKRKTGCSSQRLQSEKQQRQQSCFSLYELPYNSSQIKEVAISRIEFINKIEYVYDIQVEDNNNFFAEDVLVHNCIIDDPIKGREDANSKLMRDKVWDIYTEEVLTRLLPGIGALILIFTRWHLDDPVGRIEQELLARGKKLEDEWEVLHLPAIAEKDEEYKLRDGSTVGRKKGESIWESRFPADPVLQRIKDSMPATTWAALYQQNPISKETQVFKPEMFQQIDEDEVDKRDTVRFLAIDPSSGSGDDYTGFADVRVDTETKKWYVHAWHEKLKPLQLIDRLFELREMNRYAKIGMEGTMYQKVIEPFLKQEMVKRNAPFYIEELKNKNLSKDLRVYGLEPMYSSGKIFHIRDKCKVLEEELAMYGSFANDDVADALAFIPDMIKEFNIQQDNVVHYVSPEVPNYD